MHDASTRASSEPNTNTITSSSPSAAAAEPSPPPAAAAPSVPRRNSSISSAATRTSHVPRVAVAALSALDTPSSSSGQAKQPHLDAAQPQHPPHSAAPASATELDRSREVVSLCATCHEDRIHGVADVLEAAKITWQRQRSHLFTSWIHVPLGVCFMLVVVWGLKLAIDQAPFRFPAAVLAAFGLFGLLLLLDWLSLRFPGAQAAPDPETAIDEKKGQAQQQRKVRKRFLDPVMALMAPPCDFCLRNMSVMFTPSFILIPAREVIPGKEIGLIAAWFTITQFVAFVIPILLNWGLDWLWKVPSRVKRRRQAAKWQSKRKEILSMSRRNSTSSLRKGSTAGMHNPSHRGSTATIVGLEFEKGVSYSGGQKLGPIASGLAGVTATLTAPVAHIQMEITDDEMRHMDAVAIEQARQQGDPEVERIRVQSSQSNFTPRSDVSYFSHPRHDLHQHHHHLHMPRSPRTPNAHAHNHRPRSLSVEPALGGEDGAQSVNRRPRSAEPSGPRSAPPPISRTPSDSAVPFLSLATAQATPSLDYKFPAAPPSSAAPSLPPLTVAFEPDLPTAATLRAEGATSPSSPGTRRGSEIELLKEAYSPDVSRRPSLINGIEMFQHSSSGTATPSHDDAKRNEDETSEEEEEEDESSSRSASASSYGPDAIERLASWMGDLITPGIYFLVFLVGVPLWFAKDFALPLFLGVNLLCFIAGITIVPAKVRRFLHPILSCSISTVLVLWAFGAMKGLSIKETLAFYSSGAKYTVLWDPSGYVGPVPGAGDVLFSTLDAGIVALAIPMYRYRVDLRKNFARMVSALIPCAALSLFFWPYIAHKMGMDEVRSLAFAARFMSTPLAIELANNIGADKSIVVILVVITGIVFAVLKDPLFRLLRVTDDMTIGLTSGSTAGAIGASSLLAKPRQMAIASLSFILFGTLLLVATSIPTIVETVQKLAGPDLLARTTGA